MLEILECKDLADATEAELENLGKKDLLPEARKGDVGDGEACKNS